MTEHGFDKDFWDQHWRQAPESVAAGAGRRPPPNPHLVRETQELVPGTALDAGCGEGAEATWLASRGWDVTAADISAEALARAAARAVAGDAGAQAGTAYGRVRWIEADLSVWEPDMPFDLVITHYAHPAMPQLAFYERIAGWVAPGGTLLVVGHLHHDGATGHGEHPPAEASVVADDITAGLDDALWEVVTAGEHARTATGPGGAAVALQDVVVRATRRT